MLLTKSRLYEPKIIFIKDSVSEIVENNVFGHLYRIKYPTKLDTLLTDIFTIEGYTKLSIFCLALNTLIKVPGYEHSWDYGVDYGIYHGRPLIIDICLAREGNIGKCLVNNKKDENIWNFCIAKGLTS